MLYLTLAAWPLLTHRRIDTVVSTEVVEADVVHPTTIVSQTHKQRSDNARLISRLPNLLIDAAPTTIDGTVLSSHDSLDSSFILDTTSKTGNLRDDNNDLKR